MNNSSRFPEVLIRRCLKRDDEAWQVMREGVADLIVRVVARKFFLSLIEQQDLVQQTIEELLRDDMRALRAFKGESKFDTYLIVIATRIVLKWIKRPKDKTALDELMPDDLQKLLLARAEFWADAERCLSSDDLFLLRLLMRGLSYQEISHIVGKARGASITTNEIAVRKHRIIQRLRKCFGRKN